MKRLKNKYRFVILNDKNFEEKASFSLKGIRVITFLSIIFLLLFTLVFSIIAFTPLREYIPGYADVKTKKRLNYLVQRTDSLEYELLLKEQYMVNIQRILSGNISDSIDSIPREIVPRPTTTTSLELRQRSREDSLLRLEFEKRDPYELFYRESSPENATKSSLPPFFPPVKGVITESFNKAKEHYAVDLVAPSNTGIKSVQEGTVVFSDWTTNTGYTIIVQHANQLISVYKHNSVLLKKVGNFVRAGEILAIIGETGELSNGPHLHFELWHAGKPIDPAEFIVF